MPKTVFERRSKYEKITALIYGTAKAQGRKNPELARMVGLSESTLYQRIKHPENMTLDELTCLGRGLNIPIDEIRQCITY